MVVAAIQRPIVAVIASVVLGLVSATVLKEAADAADASHAVIAFAIFVALAANALRFVLWGIVYRSHEVSATYPLGSIIFPLVFAVGVFVYDEPVTFAKACGTVAIMIGVGMLSATQPKESSSVSGQ